MKDMGMWTAVIVLLVVIFMVSGEPSISDAIIYYLAEGNLQSCEPTND